MVEHGWRKNPFNKHFFNEQYGPFFAKRHIVRLPWCRGSDKHRHRRRSVLDGSFLLEQCNRLSVRPQFLFSGLRLGYVEN